MLKDEYERVLNEYNQKIQRHKDEIRDDKNISELCNSIKEAYYDITVGKVDRTLYSGKEVIAKLDDSRYWSQHLTLNQDFVGTQYGDGTSKKSTPTGGREFVKYMMEYGDDIADYLSTYNNKQKNTRWFVSILNEHIGDLSSVEIERSIDATGYDSTENEEIQINKILCTISTSGRISLDINDMYGWEVNGSPHSLMICERIYDDIEEVLVEAIQKINEKKQNIKTTLEIVNQEFTTELVAERI